MPGALLAFFIFIPVALVLPSEDCLVAESGDHPLFVWPIKIGDCFSVTFTHSLNRSPITDIIEWTGGEMILRKSIFKTFGAGVPTPADDIGTELVFVDGHYELLGIDKHMRSFAIMIQTAPSHRISMNGREASLLELAGSGKTVEIAIKRMNLISRLITAIQNW